jgi:hypothetical protein
MIVSKIVMFACTRIGKGLFLLILLWMAWEYFGPKRPVVSAERKGLADAVAPVIVDQLHAAQLPIETVALVYFESDPSGYVTDTLRAELEAKWPLDLLDLGFFQKLRNFLGLRPTGHGEVTGAVDAVKSRGVDGVIFGTVHRFDATDGGAVLELELAVAEVPSGRPLFTPPPFVEQTGSGVFGGGGAGQELHRLGLGKRLFFLALLVLLLPVFTIGFLRGMVRKRDNRTNGLVLGVYLTVDVILAILLLGTNFHSTLSVLLLILVVGVALLYNVALMTQALRLEED